MTIEKTIAEAVSEQTSELLDPLREQLTAIAEALDRGPAKRRRLTRAEAATHWSVSTRSVDGWLAKGCPCLRLGGPGGSPRFDVEELDQWHRAQSA